MDICVSVLISPKLLIDAARIYTEVDLDYGL